MTKETKFTLKYNILFLILLAVCPLANCMENNQRHGLPTRDITTITLSTLGLLSACVVFACVFKNCVTKTNEGQPLHAECTNNEIQAMRDTTSNERLSLEQGEAISTRHEVIPESGPRPTTYVNILVPKRAPNPTLHVHGRMYEQVQGHIQMNIPEETIEQVQDSERNQGTSASHQEPDDDYGEIWKFKNSTDPKLINLV